MGVQSVMTHRMAIGKCLSLSLEPPPITPRFPTDRLQKGWLLAGHGRLLVEEGTGFGLPIVRYGLQTVFPASARVIGTMDGSVMVTFDLAMVERLFPEGTDRCISPEVFYRARECFCSLHRRFPFMRKALGYLFDGARSFLQLRTTYEPIRQAGNIEVTVTPHPEEARLAVSIDTDNLDREGCTEIIIANEQGASFFDLYRDSSGVTNEGESIGSWDEVTASQASLVDRHDGIIFTLDKLQVGRLFRGREFKSGRLAWAGLNYVLPPHIRRFQYEIRLEQL